MKNSFMEPLDTFGEHYGRSATVVVTQFPLVIRQAGISDSILANVLMGRQVHNSHHIE